MLRDDREVALDELITLCGEAADRYADAKTQLSDAELQALFEEFSGQRRAMAETLSDHLRGLGALPRAPDPDAETAHLLIGRIKAALSSDERLTLIEECEHTDGIIATRMAAAADVPLPDETRRLLRLYHGEVVAALGRLAAAKARL